MITEDATNDDGTRPSRFWRDRTDRGRGAGQTHGASNASGVDGAPDGAEDHPDATALPPSASHGGT